MQPVDVDVDHVEILRSLRKRFQEESEASRAPRIAAREQSDLMTNFDELVAALCRRRIWEARSQPTEQLGRPHANLTNEKRNGE